MKKVTSLAILVAAVFLLSGNNDPGRLAAWEIKLGNSSLYTYLGRFETSTVHPAWMVDRETPEEAIVAVGWNTDWRFERVSTIKVDKKTCGIFLQRDDPNGGEYWAPVKGAFVPYP